MELKKIYVNSLKNVKEKLETLDIDTKNINELSEEIRDVELLLPVVGAFSAGKSTFLNNFLGKNYLETSITPETALAAELRYSLEEYILAKEINGGFKKFNIDDMKLITQEANNYEFIRVYINSEKLKKIEPLVLVDMPGFNSPLDEHNKAIYGYISKGAHYLVLTSVEEGIINKSTLEQLRPILMYGKTYDLFLTKCNLRIPEDVEKIKASIEEVIEFEFDEKKEVIKLYDSDNENFNEFINNVSVDGIYKNLYLEKIEAYINNEIENIKLYAKTLQNEMKDNEKLKTEITKSIDILNNEKTNEIRKYKEKYTQELVDNTIESLEMELGNELETIVDYVIMGDNDSANEIIDETLKTTVFENVKIGLDKMAGNVTRDIETSLSKVSDLEIFSKVGDIVVENLKSKIIINNKERETDKKLNEYRKVGGVLAILTNVLNPLFEIAILALPDIINYFRAAQQEKQKKEEVTKTLLNKSFPKIYKKIRNELPKQIDGDIGNIINGIVDGFEIEISKKQELLKQAESYNKDEKIEIISKIEKVKEEIIKIKENLLGE